MQLDILKQQSDPSTHTFSTFKSPRKAPIIENKEKKIVKVILDDDDEEEVTFNMPPNTLMGNYRSHKVSTPLDGSFTHGTNKNAQTIKRTTLNKFGFKGGNSTLNEKSSFVQKASGVNKSISSYQSNSSVNQTTLVNKSLNNKSMIGNSRTQAANATKLRTNHTTTSFSNAKN
jgi:hypothetical protein